MTADGIPMKSRIQIAAIHMLSPLTVGWLAIATWLFARKTNHDLAVASLQVVLWHVAVAVVGACYGGALVLFLVSAAVLKKTKIIENESLILLLTVSPATFFLLIVFVGFLAGCFVLVGRVFYYPLPPRRINTKVQELLEARDIMASANPGTCDKTAGEN